jgi:putative transposase
MKNVVKVRIYPTPPQKQLLSKAFGCARWYWNNSLNATNELYKETGKGLSQIGMNSRLPALKKEFEWLGETYSQVLQSVSLNLSRAFVNFFEGRASFPKFKSKHDKQSIQYPQYVEIVDDKSLKFPGKLGIIPAKIHRQIGNSECLAVACSLSPPMKLISLFL